jgi:hypothetical protein
MSSLSKTDLVKKIFAELEENARSFMALGKKQNYKLIFS